MRKLAASTCSGSDRRWELILRLGGYCNNLIEAVLKRVRKRDNYLLGGFAQSKTQSRRHAEYYRITELSLSISRVPQNSSNLGIFPA